MSDSNIFNKKFDLEERTSIFAIKARDFIKKIPKTLSNIEYCKQFIRSSGSMAANYIEANESFSKKDYYMRVKICRKETKESRLWLRLIEVTPEDIGEREKLIAETNELMKIFGAIITNSKQM
jgi:four helix bundle protein